MKHRWSKRYYLTYGNGCRRVILNGSDKEFPGDFRKAKVCKQTGKHPHKGKA